MPEMGAADAIAAPLSLDPVARAGGRGHPGDRTRYAVAERLESGLPRQDFWQRQVTE
jgi:hypothetical protein